MSNVQSSNWALGIGHWALGILTNARRARRVHHRVQFAVGLVGFALLVTAPFLSAQDTYFHRGAQQFLAGSNALAKAEVERGLQAYPDNPNLKKFWELLNQQQQQDSKDQKDQEQKDQDQKDQKDQKDKKQDQQQKNQQNQDKEQSQDKKDSSQEKQDKEKQDSQKPDQQPKPDDQKSAQQKAADKDKDKKDGQEGKAGQAQKPDESEGNPEGQPGQAVMRMTPQQAVQLLEALKGEERTLQFRPILRTNRTERLLKDW